MNDAGSCPAVEHLAALNAGLLSGEALDSVARHLDQCPDCLVALGKLAPAAPAETEALRRQATAEAYVNEPGCRAALERFRTIAVETEANGCGSEPAPVALGRYRILARRGEGAFGVVYEGYDDELQRPVAIKVAHPHRLTSAAQTDRFLTEARVLARLDHPDIVPVYDVGRTPDGLCYLVAKLIEGTDLTRRLQQGRLTPMQSVELVARVAEALHHAHEHGVIHRDLKPANILLQKKPGVRSQESEGRKEVTPSPSDSWLLTPDSSPKITDFGLALRSEDPGSGPGFAGTPAYMSPEQARGEGSRVDGRSDVYSLGVVFYELLTGTRPFHADTVDALLEQVRTQPVRPPREIDGAVPLELERICLKAMARETADRYGSARQLAGDLRYWQARQAPRLRGRMARGALAIGLALLLAAVVLAVVLRRHATGVERERQRERAMSLVDSVLNARPDGVPDLLVRLRDYHDEAPAYLRTRLDGDLTPRQHFRAVCALATLGEPDEEALLAIVKEDLNDECPNLVLALEPVADQVAGKLLRQFLKTPSQGLRAKLALVLLSLKHPGAARNLLQVIPEPLQRTIVIDVMRSWHGRLTPVAEVLRQYDDPAFRSGICAALGQLDPTELAPEERRRVEETLLELYQKAPDGGTHSATGWALRRWKVALPALAAHDAPPPDKDWFVNKHGMTLLKVPRGSLLRKSAGDAKSTPPAVVSVTRSFYLSNCEVTVRQFREFQSTCSPNPVREQYLRSSQSISPEEDSPAHIGWLEALQFCNWLSAREKRKPCYRPTNRTEKIPPAAFLGEPRDVPVWECDFRANGYRLPTEAEWEHACRARSTRFFAFGSDAHRLENYGVVQAVATLPVGSKLPNAWGFFDMHGNLAEWCWDRWEPYPDGNVVDPTGAPQGRPARVYRGGWFNCTLPVRAHCGHRDGNDQLDYPLFHIGLRVACTADE